VLWTDNELVCRFDDQFAGSNDRVAECKVEDGTLMDQSGKLNDESDKLMINPMNLVLKMPY
jgi:hypothetical protein